MGRLHSLPRFALHCHLLSCNGIIRAGHGNAVPFKWPCKILPVVTKGIFYHKYTRPFYSTGWLCRNLHAAMQETEFPRPVLYIRELISNCQTGKISKNQAYHSLINNKTLQCTVFFCNGLCGSKKCPSPAPAIR